MSPGLAGVKDFAGDLAGHGWEFVRALVRIVWIYLYQARIQEAIELLGSETVRRIAEHLDPTDRARLKLARAQAMQFQTMLVRKGHEEALAVVNEVALEAEQLRDKQLLSDAKCLESWLRINLELSNGHPSDPVFDPIESCLGLRQELADNEGIAEALFLRGLAEENVSGRTDADIDKALGTYCESNRLAKKAGDKRIQSYNAYHMGTIAGRRDNLDQALELLMSAYNLRAAIGMKVFLPGPCLAVGRTYLAMDDPANAEAYCRETLRLADEIGHHAFRFFALMGLGDVAEAHDEIDIACRHFEQAAEVGREIERQAFVERATGAITNLTNPR
ncbi:hypothetical protein ACFLSZ_02130 [Candidatus Bipolaricaulota bacterium]